jgi:hypothetical protein
MTSLIDLQFNRFGGSGCAFTVHGQHAVVFLDDAASTEFQPGTTVTETLLRFGDVIIVSYPTSWGFGAKRIARQVAEVISQYAEVTFVALGTGGLLAYDAITNLEPNGLPLTRLILANAMSSTHDTAKWLRLRMKRAASLPWFPSPVRWVNRLLHDAPPTEHEDGLVGAPLREWELHHETLAELPYGTYLRRLAYVDKHPELKPEVLDGVAGVYIQSGFGPNSGAIPAAYDCWDTLLGGRLTKVQIPRAANRGTLGHPTAWCTGLLEAFEALGIKPLDE